MGNRLGEVNQKEVQLWTREKYRDYFKKSEEAGNKYLVGGKITPSFPGLYYGTVRTGLTLGFDGAWRVVDGSGGWWGSEATRPVLVSRKKFGEVMKKLGVPKLLLEKFFEMDDTWKEKEKEDRLTVRIDDVKKWTDTVVKLAEGRQRKHYNFLLDATDVVKFGKELEDKTVWNWDTLGQRMTWVFLELCLDLVRNDRLNSISGRVVESFDSISEIQRILDMGIDVVNSLLNDWPDARAVLQMRPVYDYYIEVINWTFAKKNALLRLTDPFDAAQRNLETIVDREGRETTWQQEDDKQMVLVYDLIKKLDLEKELSYDVFKGELDKQKAKEARKWVDKREMQKVILPIVLASGKILRIGHMDVPSFFEAVKKFVPGFDYQLDTVEKKGEKRHEYTKAVGSILGERFDEIFVENIYTVPVYQVINPLLRKKTGQVLASLDVWPENKDESWWMLLKAEDAEELKKAKGWFVEYEFAL